MCSNMKPWLCACVVFACKRVSAHLHVCVYLCEFTGSEDYCYLRISLTCKTSSHLLVWVCIYAQHARWVCMCMRVPGKEKKNKKKRWRVNSGVFTASTKGREHGDIHKLIALLSWAMLPENKIQAQKENMNFYGERINRSVLGCCSAAIFQTRCASVSLRAQEKQYVKNCSTTIRFLKHE